MIQRHPWFWWPIEELEVGSQSNQLRDQIGPDAIVTTGRRRCSRGDDWLIGSRRLIRRRIRSDSDR